jgi:adenine-specific DNA-methyltransferase
MLDYLKRLIITLKKTTAFGKIYTQLIENLNKCPDMQNLLDHLKILLQKDERILSQGEILKNKVIELALKLDKNLIKLLLSDEKMKEVFFVDVDGTLIFDKDKFVKFVSNKQFLPDSYTAFKNKIGLIDEKGEFISEKKEVVLSWPYKDCVLEGGMTKEDQKRDEIFWNEILAPDQITRLLDPKVFTNAKRIDKDGEHKFDGFRTDAKGDIKDNLIIKGNNLLVLHSLKKRFAGKVKMIYIDPPYNTGNDSFKYNDSFNHSTYLVFMKNRLEIAHELLRDDGIIFVQCDDNEQAYLKVLMDEIFNRENFIVCIAVRSSTPSGIKTAHKQKTIIKQKDYILVFAKNKSKVSFKPQYTKATEWDTHYSVWIEKGSDGIKLRKLVDKLREEGILDKNQTLRDVNINDKNFKKFYLENAEKIARWTSHKNKEIIELCTTKYKDKLYVTKDENGKETIYLNKQVLQPLSYSINYVYYEKRFIEDISFLVCDFWGDIDFQNTQNEGGVSLPAGKKPEFLIFRIIDMTTEPGDLILDFFAGSGTTCAVAHKMGRQYIGVEQIDDQMDKCLTRLNNVINGDQSGISKAVGWKGGGDFVYLELMKWNENFVEKILTANTKEELKKLWETMKEKAFLSYKVDIKAVDENAKDFADLSIEDQKRFLLECLDKNHLYVNYSEIDDEEYGVSEEDKKLNREFYQS